MNRIYIFAKAISILLGIYALNFTIRFLEHPYLHNNGLEYHKELIIMFLTVVLIGLIFSFTILKNNWLLNTLVKSEDLTIEPINPIELIKALQIVVIFAGLLLLPTMLSTIISLKDLPLSLRAIIFLAVGVERYRHQLPASNWYWIRTLGGCLRISITIYCLLAAPGYIKWQVKKTLKHCSDLKTS